MYVFLTIPGIILLVLYCYSFLYDLWHGSCWFCYNLKKEYMFVKFIGDV